MSDEGGTWSSDGGQRWEAGFTVLGEDDLKKDLDRREEWSDISDDESPAIYADISHSTGYHYNAIQPKGTVWDSSYMSHESSVAVHGTPAAFSFPFQDGVFWSQQQQVVLPEVASGSTAYPVVPYPSVSYPSALYPSAIYQTMEEKTMACSLDEGRKMEEEEKKKSRNESFIDQTVAAERHKVDPPKNSGHLGSELKGEEPVTSSLASGPSSNLESLETTPRGHLTLEEPHAPNSCSSGLEHNYLAPMVLPESDPSMSYRESQCEYAVESGHSGATTSRERGESAVTVFASSSKLSLDSCHKGVTTMPLEPIASQQREENSVCKNSSELLAKEIGMSLPSESPPTRCDEKRAIMADSGATTSRERGESAVTVFASSSELSLDSCHKGRTRISLEPITSQQREVNPVCKNSSEPLAKEIGMSSPVESPPTRCDEKRAIMADSGATTSRERGESAVTVFASSSELSLDSCHKGGTTISLEPITSQQREVNPVCKNSSEPLAKEIGMSSPVESPPTRCDEKRAIMADDHRGTLEELCVDISGQDGTDINASDIIQHPAVALSEIDSMKDGGSTQLGMGVTGILKKPKRKAGRPFKKKTLLKMSKLVELVKECGKDAKDPHVNEATDVPLKHLVKSDMQGRNASLNSPNDKSLPCTSSIPSEVKEYIHNLSISPLPKRPIQVPKTHPPLSLIALSGNSNRHEDCMEHPKKCVQATQCKAKPHKKASRKPVLARKTRQSESHRLKSIRKTRNKSIDLNTEKCRDDSLGQPTGSQSSSVKSPRKPVILPVVGDVSAIKQSSKLSSNAVIKASTRSSAQKSSKKRDGNISENMELSDSPLMPTRVKLTKKQRKKISVKSRKAGPKARLQLNSADPHIISPQKELENTISIKGKVKNANKQSHAISATPKGKKAVKGCLADTQNESELLCEVMDANELQVMTRNDKNPKRRGKVKRKGTPKRSKTRNNPGVLPSITNETVLPETLPDSSMKPFKKAPKQSAKTTSKKMLAIEEKGQNGEVDPHGLPLEKDALCSKEDMSVNISQSPLRERKARKRKAREDGENGHQNQNNCSVDQIPNSSIVTLNESDHGSTQPKSSKRWSNMEPSSKTHGYHRPKNETKTFLGASQPVSTESVLLHTDSEKLMSQVPENSLLKQRKSHKKRVSDLKEDGKLPEVNMYTTLRGKCIVSPQNTPKQTPKGSSSKKKTRVPQVPPASQENSMDMSTETSLPKTTTPRKVKKGEMTLPKEEQVQLSVVNHSFDFTEEEFHVPVIKVTSRKDVPLEMTTPKQSCKKMSKNNSGRVKRARTGATKIETSQESKAFINTNTFSELPEIKPEPLAIPLSVTKSVKKTKKGRTPKSSLEQLVGGHSDSQKLKENSSGNKVDGKCTEIKMEQAEFALSAVDMGHPAGLQQSSMQTTDYVAMLKRKPGRPFKKKTLLRMAKILEIVQETESSSTENGGIANYVEEILPKKQHQPQVKREKVKALVTPTRRSLRTVFPVKSESSLHPLSTISMDTYPEGNTDSSCSGTLNRLSSPDKCFTDSNDTTVDDTDQQDPEEEEPQQVTEVESTAVRALRKRKKRKVFNPKQKKMRWRKLCQQLANVTATQEADLLSNNQDGACVSTNNIDVSCKVSSLPLSCKEEELEHAILHKSNTSTTESGTRLQTLKTPLTGSRLKTQKKKERGRRRGVKTCSGEDAGVSLELSALPPTQERDDAELHRQSSPDKCLPNTSALDSNDTSVDDIDQQCPQKVTEVESTTVRALKKKKKRKVFNPKQKKMRWRKLCQQLANVTATQEADLLSNNQDGACVSTNNIDVSCKVSSLSLACKEEELEHAILHKSTTESGTRLQTLRTPLTGSRLKTQKRKERRDSQGVKTCSGEDAGVSLEPLALPLNQERDELELHALKSLTKVKRDTGHTRKKKTSVKKSKLMAVVQTVSELAKSQPKAKRLGCSKNVTTVKVEECMQSVSVTYASSLRRSLRRSCSDSLPTVDQGPYQPTQNSDEEAQSSQSFVLEAKTQMLGDLSLNESKVKDDNPSFEKQYDGATLPSSNVQQPAPMPGKLKQRKTRKGLKRRFSSRTSGVVKSDEVTDTTVHSDSSLTVALNTSEHQSTSVEHENTLVKDEDPSFEKQYDGATLPSSNVQQPAPMPGKLKQRKTRKGLKRRLSSRTSGVLKSDEVTDTTVNSNSSLTVAFNTSECQSTSVEHENTLVKDDDPSLEKQYDDVTRPSSNDQHPVQSTSVEHENTLKKSKIMMEKLVKGEMEVPVKPKMEIEMEKRAQQTLLELSGSQPSDADSEKVDDGMHRNHLFASDLKNHTPAESRRLVKSTGTPLRRSGRATKIASLFYRSEYTSAVTETASSPNEDRQDIRTQKKTLQPSKTIPAVSTEEQVVTAVSADAVEIANGCSVSDKDSKPDLEQSPAVAHAQASSGPVGKTAETEHLIVKQKRRRGKSKGWGNRRHAKGKGTPNVAQANEQPVVQNVKVTAVEDRKNSFAHNSQSNEEESPQTDGENVVMTSNVLAHSGCQTSHSLNMLFQSPPDVQKVDGCTQYSEEECGEQRIISKFPAGWNVRAQSAKKTKTSIKCRFCGRSFRHISAYTVHQRLHTGERPYQCQHCGKRFAQVSKLKSHKSVHKVQGFIQCPCCSQQFSKKEQLIVHFKVHLSSVDHITSNKRSSQESPSKRPTNSPGCVFNCPVCGKEFLSKQKLELHHQCIHKGESLSCKDCGKTFSKQSSLSAHERVHWPLKPFACSVCGKGFSKLRALKAHSLEHTGETPFSCSHCGYACSDLQTLRAHQASRICSAKKQDDIEGFLVQMGVDGQVNTPSLFKCHLCKKLLNHWCQYTLHLQTHTKAHPYLCDMCGQSYDKDSDVRVHCSDCCKSSGEEKACSGPLSDIWISQETEETSLLSQQPDSPEHMNEQILISPDNSPVHSHPLEEDHPQSKNPDQISSSAEVADPPSPRNSRPPSPTPSGVSILSSHPSLDCYVVSSIHARTRTSLKRFECQHCGKTFRLHSILRAHLEKHLSGNKYTCGLCGRVFQRWHKLWLHQRHHQKKGRSFLCSDCNVQFYFLGLYREHLREHAEQRPYACPLCPETFLSEESLNTHQCENHRPRRALRCEVCGKGFSSLRNWVKHSLLHNGRSSHRCLLCYESFANNRALQVHLKTHNNDLRFPTSEIPSEPLLFPHQCWHCNASFSTGELLYAHQICHAVGGKPPARPKFAPTGQSNSNDVSWTLPPPTVPESSSVPVPSVAEQAPVPEISDESLFHYAHPDSLYVVPDASPPPPLPRHNFFSRSGARSSSQASNLSSSQQVITLDEDSLQDAADTSQNAPSTSHIIPDSSPNADVNLPQTSSQQSITPSLSGTTSCPIPVGSSASHPQDEPTLSLQVKHTLPPRRDMSKDTVKRFSITVQLQDTRGFECADCNISLSSVTQLHKHYLKHAKGVLAKVCI